VSTTWTWAVRDRPALRERVGRSATGCLIVGPAGVGKTTLARQTIERSDRPSIVVRGIEGLSSVPFAALNAARAEQGADIDEDGDVVRRLRTWLSDLARDGVWVLVDDADALDPPSSGLLSYAAQTEDLHLLVTMRTGHHLPSDLDRVALHQSWASIAIEPWTASEVSEALATTLGGPVSPALAAAVHDLSGGIPLVARELVFDGIAAERIRFDGHEWSGAPSVGSPESAARLIGRRLPTGGPPLAVLQMLAIAGQLRPELLDRLAPEDVLIELDAQGLLEFPTGSSLPYVRLAHPMVADALRSGLDDHERQQRLSTLVAASRELAHPDELGLLQSLHWAIEIGDDLSLDELRNGSALALRHMDYALAADIAGELQRLEPSAGAAFVHAVALARAARFDEAMAIADDARALATTTDEIVALARILVRLHSAFGRTIGYVGGDPSHAAEVAAWADDHLGGSSFAVLLAAFTAFGTGALADAVELADQVVRETATPGIAQEADDLLIMIAPIAGRFDIARSSLARHGARPPGSLHLPALMGSEGAQVSLLMYDGRLADALAADEAAFERASRALAYDEMMNAAAQRGIRGYLMGDLDRAIEAFELCLQYRVVPSSRTLLVHGILAAAQIRRGDVSAALRTLEQADLERDSFSAALLHLDYDHLSAFVRTAAGVVDPADARAQLRSIAEEADALGYQWLHTITRLSMVRLGLAEQVDGEALLATATTVDALLIRTAASVVVAATDGDVDRLVDLADQLAAMGARTFEVDTLTAALSIAATAEPAGAPARDAIGSLRARLERAVAACAGMAPPSVTADEAGRPALTDREAQIATLAADGLASKQIAEQLGLSSRTVDNTLRRVYTKLGISKRGELAGALER
jgi:DNA-binding CsgD family transcriptional regulator/tetratricopeptide (TPR) repeat protein